jgi:4-carboxymuconolactone decarboxylase
MTSRGRSREELLQDLADGDLAAIGHDTQDRERAIQISGLDPETFQLAEIIALVAMDAQPASWYLHLGAPDATLNLERIVGALIAVAPIVGSSRVISAAANIVGVRDFVDELDDESA